MTFFPYQDTSMRPNDASDSDTPDPSDDEQDSAMMEDPPYENIQVKQEEVEPNHVLEPANNHYFFNAPNPANHFVDNAPNPANHFVDNAPNPANHFVENAPNPANHFVDIQPQAPTEHILFPYAPNKSFQKSMVTRRLKPNLQVLAHDPVFDAPDHIPHISFQSAHSSF